MRVSADDENRAPLAREFFQPDHPHYAEARFGSVRGVVPGNLVMTPVETDERVTEVKTFRCALWDARDAAQGTTVAIGSERYTVAQRERDGLYFAVIELAEVE